MHRLATASLLVMLMITPAIGCGSSDSSNGGTAGTSGSGGTSGGSGGTSGSGGVDAGDCTALKTNLDAKLAQAASCFAGTPNPSTCEIVQDGLCNCAAVNTASGGVDYIAAAKAFKAAGCNVACPGIACPATAVCKPTTPGSTQGTCQPSF